MDYFQYHSGTGNTFIGKLPSSSDIPPQFAARAILASPKALLKIRFETNQYAPNHLVTLRNAQDGWTKDIFGTYQFGGWEFFLEKPSYSGNIEFKFVLDRT